MSTPWSPASNDASPPPLPGWVDGWAAPRRCAASRRCAPGAQPPGEATGGKGAGSGGSGCEDIDIYIYTYYTYIYHLYIHISYIYNVSIMYHITDRY